jgi:hypothetical protein
MYCTPVVGLISPRLLVSQSGIIVVLNLKAYWLDSDSTHQKDMQQDIGVLIDSRLTHHSNCDPRSVHVVNDAPLARFDGLWTAL